MTKVNKFLIQVLLGAVVMDVVIFIVTGFLIILTPRVVFDTLHNNFSSPISVMSIFALPGAILGIMAAFKAIDELDNTLEHFF